MNYALAGQWPSAILMAVAFTTVITIVLLRMGGYLSFAIYRQSTILFTFICPVLLTFLPFLAGSLSTRKTITPISA